RRRVLVADPLGDPWRQLAEDAARPREEPVEHRRLEEPRRPDVDAHQEAVGELLDERLPGGLERARLRGERGLALEVHAGEVHDEVRVAGQQALHPGGRALAAGARANLGFPCARGALADAGAAGARRPEWDDAGRARLARAPGV